MIIVNDPRNLPHRIIQIKVRNQKLISKRLLDYVTDSGFKCGVKRYKHYILTVDSIFRTSFPLVDVQFHNLMRLVTECAKREFTLIMLSF